MRAIEIRIAEIINGDRISPAKTLKLASNKELYMYSPMKHIVEYI